MSKLTFILKKVRRFLQYKMEEKNDWYARCKQKKAKKVNKKNKNSINQSFQLLISSDSYFVRGIYSPIHIMPKSLSQIFFVLLFFCFFYCSNLVCVSYDTKLEKKKKSKLTILITIKPYIIFIKYIINFHFSNQLQWWTLFNPHRHVSFWHNPVRTGHLHA